MNTMTELNVNKDSMMSVAQELDNLIERVKASNTDYNFKIACSKGVLEKLEKIEYTDRPQDLDAGIVGRFEGIPLIEIPDEARSYDDTLFIVPSKGGFDGRII